MLTCSRCGQSNEASSRFCVACGNRLEVAAPDPKPPEAAAPPAGAYAPPGANPPGYGGSGAGAYGAPPGVHPGAVGAASQGAGPGGPPPGAYSSNAQQGQPYGAPPAYAAPQGAYGAPPGGAYGVPPGAYGGPQQQAYENSPPSPGPSSPAPAQPPGVGAPGAGFPQGSPAGPAGHFTALPQTDLADHGAAKMEPAKSPMQGAPNSVKLEFAETAPPLLGEDVLSRKIPDRGARQRRPGATGPDLSPSPSSPDISAPLNVPQDAPRVLAGILVSYESNPLGQSWTLHQGSNLVGRAGAVAGADLELPHATVSSRHALLTVAAHPGRVVITDFGSTNGTFVNETALVPHEPRELRDGDRVRFGLFAAIVKII